MTDPEWDTFAALLDATFSGALDESREGALRIYFGKVPPEWAKRAVDDLVMRGQTFMPVSAELVAALRRVTGSAWEHRRLLRGRSAEEQHEADAAAARVAAGVHRLLAEGDTT